MTRVWGGEYEKYAQKSRINRVYRLKNAGFFLRTFILNCRDPRIFDLLDALLPRQKRDETALMFTTSPSTEMITSELPRIDRSASQAAGSVPNDSLRKIQRLRSKVACQTCHRRKVRCDVSQTGSPCSNCQHETAICEVLPRKKHRYDT